MGDIDTDYMDLILAAKKVDADKKQSVQARVAAWQRVAGYQESTYAKEQAEGCIKEWRAHQENQKKRVKELKTAFQQYQKDKEKLAKLLAYPDDFVSREQRAAYKSEFDRAYRQVAPEMEKIATGEHELSGMMEGGRRLG
jgi:hypothetical protein